MPGAPLRFPGSVCPPLSLSSHRLRARGCGTSDGDGDMTRALVVVGLHSSPRTSNRGGMYQYSITEMHPACPGLFSCLRDTARTLTPLSLEFRQNYGIRRSPLPSFGGGAIYRDDSRVVCKRSDGKTALHLHHHTHNASTDTHPLLALANHASDILGIFKKATGQLAPRRQHGPLTPIATHPGCIPRPVP